MFRLKSAVFTAAMLAMTACSPAVFNSADVAEKGSQDSSLSVEDDPAKDDASANFPQPSEEMPIPPKEPRPMACNYPLFDGTYNTPSGSECHPADYQYSLPSGASVATGKTIRFQMYNASNLSHGWVYKVERSIATQKISIAAGAAANSIDLVLSSYEPVIWAISGNTAAIRSVHVDGYHCARVEGIDASRVRITTYEQGVIEPPSTLPLSSNIVQNVSVYEGSCLANNTLLIQ